MNIYNYLKLKMEGIKEKLLTGYPSVISYDCTLEIIKQMEKNICKIKIEEERATGFFCKIPFPDINHMLPVLMTNNHVINSELLYKNNASVSLLIKEEKDKKIINLNNRLKYTNEEYDITIIELKPKDEIHNYLKLDDIIIRDIKGIENNNNEYEDKNIYTIQYPEGELSVSYGILGKIS